MNASSDEAVVDACAISTWGRKGKVHSNFGLSESETTKQNRIVEYTNHVAEVPPAYFLRRSDSDTDTGREPRSLIKSHPSSLIFYHQSH